MFALSAVGISNKQSDGRAVISVTFQGRPMHSDRPSGRAKCQYLPGKGGWCLFKHPLLSTSIHFGTVAELRQMKSAVWLPSARRIARHLLWVPVVQPVCSHTHIRAVAGRPPHIRCDAVCGGLLEWSLKWTPHWCVPTVVNDVRKSSMVCEHGGQSQKSSIARFQYCILADAVNRDQPRLTTFERRQ